MSRCIVSLFTAVVLAGAFGSVASAQPAPAPKSSSKAPATDGQVWGALIYATDDGSAVPDDGTTFPKELSDLEGRLGKVFDHKHFKILGQHTQDILREYESWVVPSRDLFLKVDSNGPAEGGGIHLHLQFWQGEQVLVKSDAVLRAGSPLFIGGPKWRDGQLVFVLALQAEH